MSRAIHGLPIRPAAVSNLPFWVDGPGIQWYRNNWHHGGGWNPDEPGGPLRDWHLVMNENGGVVDDLTSTVTWGPRHNFIWEVVEDILVASGGEDSTGSHFDLHHYTPEDGWIEIVTSGTDYQRDHFTYIREGRYAYIIGGNNTATGLPANNIIRINLITGFREFWANLPAEMHGINNAISGILAGKFIFAGGGRFNVPTPGTNSINTKCWESSDKGLNWTLAQDTALLNSSLWANSTVSGGLLIARTGSNAANSVVADNRLLYTEYPIDFKDYPIRMPGTHASGIATQPYTGEVVFHQGLAQNNFYRMPLLATKHFVNL